MDADQKVTHLQEISGIEDPQHCRQILESHGWDLDAAVHTILATSSEELLHSFSSPHHSTDPPPASQSQPSEPREYLIPPASGLDSNSGLRSRPSRAAVGVNGADGGDVDPPTTGAASADRSTLDNAHLTVSNRSSGHVAPSSSRSPQLFARLFYVPVWAFRGGLGVVTGVLGFGFWAVRRIISFVLSSLGFGPPSRRLPGSAAGPAGLPVRHTFLANLLGIPSMRPTSPNVPEAALFRQRYEAQYGSTHPEFFLGSFHDALRSAGERFRFLLVYLHAPDHVTTPRFCSETLGNSQVIEFIGEHFVMWGADVRQPEGFRLSLRLQASTYPFCAVVTSAPSNSIALLHKFEGPISAPDLVRVLLRVVEEHGAMMVVARSEAEEREHNRRLREEQDEAYREALQADQERERQREEEASKRREEEEAVARQLAEEEAARMRAVREEEERQAEMVRRRQEAAARLTEAPAKGAETTQVLFRLPGGQRKDRSFLRSDPVQRLYDFVDSEALGDLLPSPHYLLVSNFPRVLYHKSKRALTLEEAGLHPRASLFVQVLEDGEEGEGEEGGTAQ